MKATKNQRAVGREIILIGNGNTIVLCGDGCIISHTENGQNNISLDTIGDGSCNAIGSILGSGDGNAIGSILGSGDGNASTRPMGDLQKRDELIDHLLALVEHLTAQIASTNPRTQQ